MPLSKPGSRAVGRGCLNDRKSLIDGQFKRADLSRSRLAPFKQIADGCATVPTGPRCSPKNVGGLARSKFLSSVSSSYHSFHV
jgi:hypothetical protein